MRIDRLFVYLRFVRARSRATTLIEAGHVRRNGERILRTSEEVEVGDVLTFPIGKQVRIVEITALPERRGPADFARMHYHDLDRSQESAIAGQETHELSGEARK